MTRKIGRYEILGPLATGGMAEILLARLVGPSGFERPVVIKRIRPDLDHEELTSLFLEEARLCAKVRHANVVAVEDLGTDEGAPYLVMEYLQGESLSNVARRLVTREETLPVGLAAYIIAEACAGLHAAHELRDAEGRLVGLVHRDVSPQNVFLTYDGAVKVVDFGIARTDDSNLTDPGEIRGKFGYIAPEQFKREPLDRRTDIFALGVVLYELLTGHRLFKRFSNMATIRAVLTDPIIVPSRVEPSVPPELEAICMRALSRPRDERYATASEMRRELLLAMRSHASEEPSAELSELMARCFPDRIGDKRELLRSVREGSVVDHVPAGDVDVTIDIPGLPVFDDSASSSAWVRPTTDAPQAPQQIVITSLSGRHPVPEAAPGFDSSASLRVQAPTVHIAFEPPRPRGRWLVPVMILGAVTAGAALRFGGSGRILARASDPVSQPPVASSSAASDPPGASGEPVASVPGSADDRPEPPPGTGSGSSTTTSTIAAAVPGTASSRTEPRLPGTRRIRGPSSGQSAVSVVPPTTAVTAPTAAPAASPAPSASTRGFRRFQ